MIPETDMAPQAQGTAEPVVCFGDVRLDLRLRCLYRGAEKVKLTPKPFSTLEFLIRNRERVVSKAELLDKVWGGDRDVSTVEHAISQLRRALGDATGETECVQTVMGQGYRFVAEIRATTAAACLATEEAVPSGAPEGSQEATPVAENAPAKIGVYRRIFRRPVVFAIVLVCIAVAGLGLAYFLASSSRVARVAWNGNSLVAMSDSGRMLWTYHFEMPLREPDAYESTWRTQIVDLDGDGVPKILVAAPFSSPEGRPEEVFCFSARGKVLWRYKPQANIEFNTPGLNGPWRIAKMLVVPESHSTSVWVAVVHDVWWPSFVMRISPSGERKVVFASSGDIMALRKVQTESGFYILAAGVNNEYRAASLAILRENGPSATSPQTPGSPYQCIRGCPAGRPYQYILLPRSELNAASNQPYNIAIQIHARPDGVSVETQEVPGEATTAFYEFSKDLQPARVSYCENYRDIHRRFERQGWITHSFKDCPERRSPAQLRICDEDGNWSVVRVPRAPMQD